LGKGRFGKLGPNKTRNSKNLGAPQTKPLKKQKKSPGIWGGPPKGRGKISPLAVKKTLKKWRNDPPPPPQKEGSNKTPAL